MPQLSLSPQVFAILSALVEERTGLHYGSTDQPLFAEKIAPRVEEAGFDSFLDYYYFLRYDARGPAELERLIEALVVNETYLFRELDQLRMALDELVVPPARAGRPVSIWSAACSTGEEPATIAMLLAERGVLDRCRVVASDISTNALARAREGRFGRRALRAGADRALAEKWLEPRPNNEVQLHPALLDRIEWRRVNLIDPAAVSAVGTFDLIVCRNVLIYFSDDTIRELIGRFARQLEPLGALLVGVSESLLRFGTSLVCEEHGGVFVYRKAAR